MGDRDLDRWDVGVGERDRRAASSFEPGIREKISQNRIIPIRAGVGGAHAAGDYRIERGKWPFPPYRASTCGLGGKSGFSPIQSVMAGSRGKYASSRSVAQSSSQPRFAMQ